MTAVAILAAPPQPDDERRRVRVWFGEHCIADYIARPEDAMKYEAGMRRRFMGLHVTNEPLTPELLEEEDGRELPSERLWDSVPPH